MVEGENLEFRFVAFRVAALDSFAAESSTRFPGVLDNTFEERGLVLHGPVESTLSVGKSSSVALPAFNFAGRCAIYRRD